LLRPSAGKPIDIDPPSESVTKCAGCAFFCHEVLSVGLGEHCCRRCKDKPGTGKHDKDCRRIPHDLHFAKNYFWSRAAHGTVDVELTAKIQLPIPRWLIPNGLVRWAIPLLVGIIYPLLLKLNETFKQTDFAKRAEADERGFFAAIQAHLARPAAAAPATCLPCPPPAGAPGGDLKA